MHIIMNRNTEQALPADCIDPKLCSLAMAFVPKQSFEPLYDVSLGFSRGTIFPALDKPFLGEEATQQ